MKRHISKTLAVVLAVSMLFTSLPVTAMETEVQNASSNEASVQEVSSPEEPYVLYEAVEKREESVKHFFMSDGNYLAAQYDLPVHYQDTSGTWQEYDNTLEENTEKTELHNKKSDKDIILSKKAKQNKMVQLCINEYPVSWGYEKIYNSPADIIQSESDEDSNADNEKLALTNLVQEVQYHDVYEDVDLQYYVLPYGVKENIILKSADAKKTFTVQYAIGNLTAEQVDSRTIELRTDEGQAVYVLNAPEMFDSSGETSGDVALHIVKTNGNHITVEMAADSTWLEAEGRQYPVYLDPLVTVSGQKDFFLDCYVVKKNNGSFVNMNDCRDNYVGNTADGVNRLFQKLNLPELSQGDVVTKAVMQLAYVKYEGSDMGTGDYKIDAYEITEPWTTDSVSFYQTCDSVSLDYCLVQDSAAWYSWDITKAVKHWYSGGTNNGIMLRGADESGIAGRRFFGNKIRDDSTYSAYRPCLQVYYINTTGLNDFNSYKTIDYGTYGELHINEHRGSITYTFEDVSYGGNLLNANIYHVYNSDYKDVSTAYGMGWYLNISEKVTPLSDDTYGYKLRDEDGTEIYFKKTDTQTLYEDEVGRGWTLQIASDAQTPYTLTDKQGNKKAYDGNGNLVSVTDSNGNTMTLGYSGGLVTTITDSSGRVTGLSYNGGRLESIEDPAGRRTQYSYSEDGYLTGIERYNDDGILIHYWNGRLDIVYMNTSKFALGYTNEKFEFLGEGIVGQDYVKKLQAGYIGNEKTIFTHPGVSEDITADDRILEHCLFNAWGQKITNYITDKDGTFLGKIASNSFTENDLNSVKTNNKLLETYATENADNLLSDSSFERGGSWQPIYWAESDAVDYFGIETDAGNAHIGQKAARITSAAPMDATVSFYQNLYNLPAGTYTVSSYVKTENLEGPLGAFVCGTLYYSDGTPSQDVFSEPVLGTTDTAVENGWRRISSTFTVSAGVSYVQLHAGVRYGTTGSAWFDCLQLEKGEQAKNYNLLENGGMESSSGWYFNNLASADCYYGGQALQGSSSFRMTGEYGSDKNIAQFVDVYGSEDDIYILSAWAKADSVATDGTRTFFIVPLVKYTDGSMKWLSALDFDPYNTEWQYVSSAYSVKDGDKQPQRIDVYVGYNQNQNTCYFDNIQLVKDNTQSYVYDSEGNLKNAVTVAEENSSYEYSDNEVVKAVSATGSRYYSTYDPSNKHLLTAGYADGVAYKYTHDSKGNVTQTTAVSSEIRDGGVYAFRTAFGNRAVNVYNSETADGTQMLSFTWNDSSNQKFRIEQVGETEYYTIHPANAPDKVLEVLGSGTAAGTKVCLATDTGASNQQFRFVPNSNGTCRIVPRHAENMCWDTWDENGAGIEIWYSHETESKSFVVEVAEPVEDALQMKLDAPYTASGQYLSTLTDTLGNTVSYTYDEAKDELVSRTDANGNKTAYVNSYGETNTSLVYADADQDSVQDESETYALYTSSKGLLRTIQTNNNTFGFTYDAFGNRIKSSVGSHTLMEYVYNANNGKLTGTTYGNGHQVRHVYDRLNRVSEVWKECPTTLNAFLYTYDRDGNVKSLYEGSTDTTTNFTYDTIGRLVSSASTNGFQQYQNYDAYNRISQLSFARNGETQTYRYTYNPQQLIGSVSLPTGKTLNSEYDGLNRLTQRTINTATPLNTAYTYLNGRDGTTSGLVNTMTTAEGTRSYTYDSNGNIVEYRLNDTLVESYGYDHLNQLKTVTNGTDVYEYTYDNGGNIQSVTLNGETIRTYGYTDSEWKDKLTSFNGETITYDEIGNPLQYRNGMTFSWRFGRMLESMDNSVYNIYYIQNADGMRVEKHIRDKETQLTEVHYYDYNRSRLICERWGENTLWFLYDESGSAVGLVYNGTEYYYLKNLQGDITGIADADGNVVVQYTYDVWGKVLSITGAQADSIGQINPLRYRGYYYDVETGFYYVSSRYYDPEIGRFINADKAIAGVGGNVNGYNLYSYCFNNPVNMSDPTGNWPKWVSSIGNAVKTVVNTVVNKVKSVASSVKTTILNAVKGNSNSLPTKGEPGSSQTLKNPDGTPKQKRWYGPDGNAERDRDYNHQGDVPFPHDHEWNNGKRGKDHLAPSPAYEFSIEPVLGVALASVCAIGIVVVAADDVTGVGVADDFLFGPLGTGVSTGLIMMFP